MLDFLRMLAPQHTDALRPASALRRPAMSEAQPSDVSQSLLDAASQVTPPLQTVPMPRVPGRALLDIAMQTTSRPGVPQPMQQAAPSPAGFDAAAWANLAIAPIGDLPNSSSNHAGAVEHGPAFTQPATPRRRTATSTAVDPQSLPARSPQTSTSSEQAIARADRATSRDQAAACLPPLSPTTVALYAAPSNERDTAPAIHVTIDRIEVRAPAPTSRAAPGKRREPVHTQTLGDYLRGNSKVTR